MVWVKFLADFSFKPMQSLTIDYTHNTYANVTTACAEAAIAENKAIREVPTEPVRTAAVRVVPKRANY